MSSHPVIITIKKYSYYNEIRSSIIKNKLPPQNYYELNSIKNGLNINLHNKFGSLISSPKQITEFNGDLWIIAKGFSDEIKQFPEDYRFGLFYDFNLKENTGLLFNNFMLHKIIETFFQPKRIFLYASYQGKYLKYYINSIESLQEAHGIKEDMNVSDINSNLTNYFKNPQTFSLNCKLLKDESSTN